MNPFNDEDVQAEKRRAFDAAVENLTASQAIMLDRCYPDGISDEDLDSAYGLVMRTLKKNEEAPDA